MISLQTLRFWARVLVVLVGLSPNLARASEGLAPDVSLVKVPAEATAVMPLDEVRPGMRGVCLTVFSGTAIEPFEVEVVSVVRRSGPQRAVIWLRSEDPRMLESGPVQGMSGSPVYLWKDAEPDDPEAPLGGGRLIGAFAYGFAFAKGCLIGVQPIEQMVGVGERIGDDPVDYARSSAAGAARLRDRVEAVKGFENAVVSGRAEVWGKLLASPVFGGGGHAAEGLWQSERRSPAGIGRARDGDWQAERVSTLGLGRTLGGVSLPADLVPMSIPVGGVPAALLGLGLPLDLGGGLSFVAGGGSVGEPPAWIDRQAPIEPGSVFAIPLTTGDLDLAGMGTATDVRPDGTVLAFGHAMMAEGSTAIPMASGYVHFIVPSRQISFKRGTPLRVVGTVLQDETTAVAGRPGVAHEMAEMSVRVRMDGQPDGSYRYQLARHPMFTPMLALITAANSLTSTQMPPMEHTMSYRLAMDFVGGRSVVIENTTAGGGFFALFGSIIPVMSTAMSNPFEDLQLASMSVDLDVERGLKSARILEARLERPEVAPGETVGVLVTLLPYGGEPERVRLELAVPATLEETDLPVMVGGASSYQRAWMQSNSHRFNPRDLDGLFGLIEEIENLPASSLYAIAPLPSVGLAMGRDEMRKLPGSVAGVLRTPTAMGAVPLMDVLETRADVGLEVGGELMLMLSVRRP